MRHAKFHTKEHLLALVDSIADQNFLLVDITGGEPTLHPHIVDIVRRMTERGLASRIITLGQWLTRSMGAGRSMLLDELRAAGICDFRFSVHDVDEERMQKMTGGSWVKLRGAMSILDDDNFQYQSNCTVTTANSRHLPEIAVELAKHQIYCANFLLMMAHYEHASRAESKAIQPRYSDAAPYLREAVDILEDAGIGVTVRYAPLCTIAGLERNHVGASAVRYDSSEWMNAIQHTADPEKVTLDEMKAMGRRIPMQAGQPTPGCTLVEVEGGIDWDDTP